MSRCKECKMGEARLTIAKQDLVGLARRAASTNSARVIEALPQAKAAVAEAEVRLESHYADAGWMEHR